MSSLPQEIREWLESFSFLTFLIWVGAVWLTLRLIVRGVKAAFPKLKALIELSDALADLPEFIERTDETIETLSRDMQTVKHEVLPNNGGSMRDDLLTVSLQVEKIEALQAKDFARLQAITAILQERFDAPAARTGPSLSVSRIAPDDHSEGKEADDRG